MSDKFVLGIWEISVVVLMLTAVFTGRTVEVCVCAGSMVIAASIVASKGE